MTKARILVVVVAIVLIVVVAAVAASALLNNGDFTWHQQTSLSPPTVVGSGEQFVLMSDTVADKPVDPVDYGGHLKKWHRKVRVSRRHRLNAPAIERTGGHVYQRSAVVTSLGTNGAPVSWLEATLVSAHISITWCYQNARDMRQSVVPCPGRGHDRPEVDVWCDVTALGSGFQWHCDRDDTTMIGGHGWHTDLYHRWEYYYRRAHFHFHQGPLKEFSFQRDTYVGGTARGSGDFVPTKAHSI